MAPLPQEQHVWAEAPAAEAAASGERVVISGMSGLFPQARHVKDLADILYNKKNPISEESCRWRYSHPEAPSATGNIPGLDYFDAQFFKVHYRMAQSMEPMCKKLLEMAYQAIYDAGINPRELYGKKVGVYTGTCFSESEKAAFYALNSRSGFGIAGCSKTMFANRISYWLNAKGPSMSVDEACCSSLAALEMAFTAMSHGECEAAIVGGANICLHPQSSVHYARIVSLSPDGRTKSFDENANGCARSEAINVLFLQKAKDAKRIYAEVLNVKNEFNKLLQGETGPRYGFYRDPINLAEYLKTFYQEAKVSPKEVEYVEAFGSATPEADRQELLAIEEVFCKDRQKPLLVGSVMSNIGYAEAASGICAVMKVLLAYEKGEIAANLHFENPRKDIPALRDGKMEIVAEHKPFDRLYTAVNGISVTGVDAHVLLKGNYKPKDLSKYKSPIPHLVMISARQDESVQKILDDLKSRPIDPEELALFHNIHQDPISGHLGRGYTILGTNAEGETMSLSEKAGYFDDGKRPLWFVYSGMGSQWAGMGAQLMRIPIFAAAIERCRKVLEPKGVDIIHILTSEDKTIFDNILHSFVGIAAIQIGLTDILTALGLVPDKIIDKTIFDNILHSFVGIAAIQIGLTDILTALGLVPDKIIGHSVGELGCAYADGCLTAEEMILAAYSRGLVSVQTPFIKGSMAAIGLGYKQIKDMLPPAIEVACHNGPESSTISGPADVMTEFVTELTAKGVFAKEVPCSNIAFHSRYIAEAGPGLLNYLSEVIKDPKPRSEKWLSTSIPQDRWDEPIAKYSSAEYHTNNLLSSVLFEETARLVPPTAVLIEIAPHGLLQAILKRSLPESCKHIPLTRRGHSDNAFMVLDGIGKLFMDGFSPKVANLYPKIEFPVSSGTPLLSHHVEWAHQEKWDLPLYENPELKAASAINYLISMHEDEYSYLRGHVIRGKNVYPFAAALVAVWDTLAMTVGAARRQLTVEFKHVFFYSQPPLHDQRRVRLNVTLHRGSGLFEVTDENRKVARGTILHAELEPNTEFGAPFESDEKLEYGSDDIYQILRGRNYNYKDQFRSIHKVNPSFTEAEIEWNDNWVTFLDGIIQLHVLRHTDTDVYQPIQLRKLTIDVKEHFTDKAKTLYGKTTMNANVLDLTSTIRCGGVILENMQLRRLPAVEETAVKLRTLKFIPRIWSHSNITDILHVCLQTVSENINRDTIKALALVDNSQDLGVLKELSNVIDKFHGLTINYETIPKEKVSERSEHLLKDVDLVFVENLSHNENLAQTLNRILPHDIFIINVQNSNSGQTQPSALYKVVGTYSTMSRKVELIKWRPSQVAPGTTVVSVRSRTDLNLLLSTRRDLPPQKHKLVIISPYPPVQGLKELVRSWRMDTDRNQIYLIMVAEKANLEQLPDLDLAYSVLNNGVWGGEYYISWDMKTSIDRGITLRSGKTRDLSSLKWIENPEPVESGINVTVHYAALNYLDLQKATGVKPVNVFGKSFESSYCMDFSGVTDSGKRVMGIMPTGAASSRVVARPELLWPVPDHWTLEDAATVPSAYLIAIYCLVMKSNYQTGQKIFVHGGAGGVGQAIITIALAHNCEVFTTVSDVRKKAFLMKLFPQLKADHIGNSRDPSFVDMVLTLTKGKGCRIVFCNNNENLKHTLLKCLGIGGTGIDLTQIVNKEEFVYGMHHLAEDRSYKMVNFVALLTNDNNINDLKTLQTILSESIARGFVRPLSRAVYAPSAAPRAFRLLAASRHRGRVLLNLTNSLQQAQPRISCSPDSRHIVVETCDGDSLGVYFADTLVSRGVRNLQIYSRKVSAHLQIKKRTWENLGVKVLISSKDLSNNMVPLLEESAELGPVEGMYVIAAAGVTEQSVDKISRLVADLDWATRKLSPSLRYFVIVSAETTIGQQTCFSRVKDGLPATNVNLCGFKMDDLQFDSCQISGAMDAVEQAIRSCQPTILAVPEIITNTPISEQIFRLAEIEYSEQTSEQTTLLDLKMEPSRAPIIQAFLNDVHNLCLSNEEISKLTISSIQHLEEVISGSEFKEVSGLETYFSFVDPDELQATTDIVFLPTLVSSAATMRDDIFDVSKKYLYIIPGMEGHYARFSSMCEGLKVPAVVLQPGLDRPNETALETAQRYAKLLLSKMALQHNYYLLGYESGVVVALELAAILEQHGLTGTVFLVGGAPDELQAALLQESSGFASEEALQSAVLEHMVRLMSGGRAGSAGAGGATLHHKVELCVRSLLGKVAHSAQYARAWLLAAVARLAALRRHHARPAPLRAKLVLLRAAFQGPAPDLAQYTAQLQRYCHQPPVVYQLRAPLAHAAQDLRCSAIINRHLDEEIHKIFNETNICEHYLLNPDSFMTHKQSK